MKNRVLIRFVYSTLILFLFAFCFSVSSFAGTDGTLKWKYTVSDPMFAYVLSSPAVGSDGTIYVGISWNFGFSNAFVSAIEPTGSEKWWYIWYGFPSVASRWVGSSPAVDNGTTFTGISQSSVLSMYDDGCLAAIWSNGILKGTFDTADEIISSPALTADGTMYIGCEDGKLFAIKPDGTLKWTWTTAGPIRSSPAIGADGTIYVGSDDKGLYAFNPDGTKKWRYATGGPVSSSPAIDLYGTIYVASEDGYLYAINSNAILKWKYQIAGTPYSGTSWFISSPAIGPDGTICVGTWDGKGALLTIKSNDGTLKWGYYNVLDDVVSSPAIGQDGTIYFGSDDGKLYAVDKFGTLKWSFTTGDSVRSSPAVGPDGTVYVGSFDGYLYAIYDSSGGLAQSVWPMFHHDLEHTGRARPVKPDLKANGSDDPIFVSPMVMVTISMALDAGDGAGKVVDGWLGLIPLAGPAVFPLGQFPLFDFPETTVLNGPLPIGQYVFLFVLDDMPDGILGATWWDYVIVIVE